MNRIQCKLCNAPSGVKGITLIKVDNQYYCKGCYEYLKNNGFKEKEKENK